MNMLKGQKSSNAVIRAEKKWGEMIAAAKTIRTPQEFIEKTRMRNYTNLRVWLSRWGDYLVESCGALPYNDNMPVSTFRHMKPRR
jgi:hypothetical protein